MNKHLDLISIYTFFANLLIYMKDNWLIIMDQTNSFASGNLEFTVFKTVHLYGVPYAKLSHSWWFHPQIFMTQICIMIEFFLSLLLRFVCKLYSLYQHEPQTSPVFSSSIVLCLVWCSFLFKLGYFHNFLMIVCSAATQPQKSHSRC